MNKSAPKPLNLVKSIHHIRAQTVSSLVLVLHGNQPGDLNFQSCPPAFFTALSYRADMSVLSPKYHQWAHHPVVVHMQIEDCV